MTISVTINEHGHQQHIDDDDGVKVCGSCHAAPVPINLGQGDMCDHCIRLVEEHQSHDYEPIL